MKGLSLDPALWASGIDSSSDSASIAKDFGMTWSNPQATDEEISTDIVRIRQYASVANREDQLREIHENKNLTDSQRRERVISVLNDILPSRYELASDLMARHSGGIRLGMSIPEARRIVNRMGITGSRDEGIHGYTGYVSGTWVLTVFPGRNAVRRIDYSHWERADGYAVFESALFEAIEVLGPPDATRGGADHASWYFEENGKNFSFAVWWMPAGESYAGLQLAERRD